MRVVRRTSGTRERTRRPRWGIPNRYNANNEMRFNIIIIIIIIIEKMTFFHPRLLQT